MHRGSSADYLKGNKSAAIVRAMAVRIDAFDPRQARLDAATRGQPVTCIACDEPYWIGQDCDPTALCHECAQRYVALFASLLVSKFEPIRARKVGKTDRRQREAATASDRRQKSRRTDDLRRARLKRK